MDSEPSISTVHQAILTLYRGSDISGAKEKASVWLGEFQKSLFAWSISDKLLHEKHDLESCYFAAQTMRTKIQYNFHELPPTSYESLRDSLLSHLSLCTIATDSVITTQLCLAVADLYLQVPNWSNFVMDLLTRFGGDMEKSFLLLELLKVLVEELSSRRLRVGANRREALSQEFAQQLPAVHEYLKKVCEMQGQNEVVLTRVLKCFGSWLTLPGLVTDPLVSTPLFAGVFEILSNPDSSPSLHDAATECVVQALFVVENVSSHVQLTQLLFRRVHDLLPVFHTCVAREDSGKLENYCRIFTELAESVLPVIVDNPGEGLGSLATLDLLLVCLGHHDYTLAEMTFNVWYRLSEYVYQRDSDELTNIFRPYVQRLLVALHRHCRIEADHEGIPTEHEDFEEFRRKVTEVIKDVVFIVGSTDCFKQIYAYMKERGNAATWDETEASLYVLTSIARIIIVDEEEVVPHVVEAIIHLPDNAHVCIFYTAVRLLGELSEWINVNQQYLESVLDVLLKCLKHPKLGSVTTQALEALCTSCKDKMSERLGTLLEIVNSADAMNIDNQGVLGLLRSTAAIMSSLPNDELSVKVHELCMRQTQPLAVLLQGATNGDSAAAGDKTKRSKIDPIIYLDRLAAVFRHLKPVTDNGLQHPCLDIVKELWPILLETCEKYQDNDRVIEHACRTMRFVIRSLGVQSLPLLTPLVTKMLEIYQKHPHSCFLYLGSILVDEYGQFDAFVVGLIQMLEAFVTPTFKVLEQPNALRNSPDVVDDLFRLCIRFVQKAPIAFFQCGSSRLLLQCALAAVSLDHRDACQSVNKFLVEVIDFIISAKKEEAAALSQPVAAAAIANASQLLSEFGPALVQNIVVAAIFHISTPLLRDLAEVLFELSKLDAAVLSAWLETALKSLPEHGALRATPAQLQEFHHSVLSAQDMRQVTNALRDLARLYR